MKTLGYDRLRTIAFEDSNLGWQAAINSGANCVRVQSRKDINNQLIDILEVSLPHDSIVVKPFILDLSKLRVRKKILVVYFGEFRTFEESVKTHAFLNHIPGVVDVVFSTWSETITQNTFRDRESGGVSIRPNLNKSKVTRDRIQSAFLNAGYDNFIDVSIHELPVQSDRRDAHFIFSYSLSLELAYKKIQSIMDNYDYVFMMRPDLYFPKLERTYVNKNIPDYITHPWQFDEKYSDGELGCNYVPDTQAIGDQFWFGTPSTIREAMHVILTTKTRDAISGNWHSWLHKNLSDAGLILKNLPMHEDRRTDTQAVHMLDKLGLKLIKNPAQHTTCLPIQVNRFPTFSNEQPIEVYQKNIYFSLGQTHECNEMLYNYNAKQYLKNTVICMDKELIESLTTDVKYFFDANNITLTELESSYTNYLIITLSSEIYENCIDEVNLSNREKKCVLLNTPEQLNMELIERISHGILYRDQCMTRVDPDLSRCIIFPLLLDLR
jgi:hypothetical protein